MPKPRGLRLLQGYVFDRRTGRYTREATGRFVARSKIVELMERSVQGRERRLYVGARRAVAGEISPNVWLSRTRIMLKRQYLQDAALAAGGWDKLTPADYGRIGGRLRSQYRRLAGMAEEIRAGTISEAQAVNRMTMYVGEARREFYDVERERRPPPPPGKTRLERRLLAAKDSGNCEDCLRYYDQGWQPSGTLPVPGAESVCMGNCRCDLAIKVVDTERADAMVGTKGG